MQGSVSLVLNKSTLFALKKSAHPTLVYVCTHESLSHLSCASPLGPDPDLHNMVTTLAWVRLVSSFLRENLFFNWNLYKEPKSDNSV